jgi:hypothetical protein
MYAAAIVCGGVDTRSAAALPGTLAPINSISTFGYGAERGVENGADFIALREKRVHLAQGALLATPTTAKRFAQTARPRDDLDDPLTCIGSSLPLVGLAEASTGMPRTRRMSSRRRALSRRERALGRCQAISMLAPPVSGTIERVS